MGDKKKKNMLFTFNNTKFSFMKVLLLILNIAIVLSAKKKKKEKKAPVKRKANYTSRVMNLSDDTFAEFNSTNKPFYLYFTSNNCKKCKVFKPKYEQLSDKLHSSKWQIPCIQINTDLSPKISNITTSKKPQNYFS